MASLRKRGKYWYISYYAHKTDNAKKTTTVKGYTDKSLTQKLANKLEDEAHARRKGYTDPHAEAAKVQRALPITKHLDNYEIHLRAKGCTENHINYTRKDIQRLIDHSGVTQAGAIERGMVDRWVLSLTKDAPKTVNRRISSVQQFLKHLHGIGGVSHYVLYRYPKRPTKGLESKVHRPLTADEVSKLLGQDPDKLSIHWPERRDIYRFALLTGFRLKECRSITAGSVNLRMGTITIKASDAKTKTRDQTIPLHADLVEMVKARMAGKQPTDHLFRVGHQKRMAGYLQDDCEAAGIDTTNVSFHGLRHTFITRLAENNVHPKIAQELARHASVETTLKYYTHFRRSDERAALDRLKA